MSVRKRTWTTAKGEQKECWIVDYVDQHGERRGKNFAKKKEADVYHATVGVEVRHGMHTPDSQSVTVEKAGELWVTTAETNNLERATTAEYSRHLRLHIIPHLGRTRLSQLSAPAIRQFEDTLKLAGMSPAMVKKVRGSLSMLIADAQERGLVNRNPVRELRRRKERRAERRQKGRLQVGVDIPTPDEVGRILGHLAGWRRPLLMTAIFTGLRASELRGLPWSNVDLKNGRIHVRQRADRYNKIGKPKSEAGDRTVPVPPIVLNTLREWRLVCPKGALDLVFPNGRGNVMRLDYIIEWAFKPVQVKAGVVDADGKAKYTGMHALRHFYASWCINRKIDGGQELPLKIVQSRLGHSTIAMTADTYGHLFPDTNSGDEMAAAELALINATRPQHGGGLLK
jgi:integrase